MNALPKLPNRRLCLTRSLDWKMHAWLVGAGFDDLGRVREVFLQGPKAGSEFRMLLDDACVLVSKLLTAGVPIDEIAGWMGRDGDDAASPIGAVIGLLKEIQTEDGPAVVDAYRFAHAKPVQPEPGSAQTAEVVG